MFFKICNRILIKHPANKRLLSQNVNQELIYNKLIGNDEGIAVMAMNRPKQKNAFSMNLVQEISDVVENVAADNSVRTLVIRSLIPGIFCAGKCKFPPPKYPFIHTILN